MYLQQTRKFLRRGMFVNASGAVLVDRLRRRTRFALLAVGFALFLQGCASTPQRNPLPEDFGGSARIPGIPWARTWGDEMPELLAHRLATYRESDYAVQFPALMNRSHQYLAISGGGAEGAFGAGLLAGWTATGDRPDFEIVTGVSTGALTAPFAFLGPAYDAELKEVFTTITTRDILRKRPSSAALTSNEPLLELITRYFNEKLAREIVAEHKKGRMLFIGTSNLDAGRPVIWNIGEILASGQPGALDLMHKVILASTAIPVAFPPVYIEVEAGGKRFEEAHVDGGTSAQVFVYPSAVEWRNLGAKLGVQGQPQVYVIRNSTVQPKWKAVKPNLVSIAGHAISSLIRTQGIGDLNTIYLISRRDGNDFNLAYVPESFDKVAREPFDPEYMRALFDLGYGLAKEGYPWRKAPPGVEAAKGQ